MTEDRLKSIDEKIKNLVERTHDFQTKLTYYILAVDAACIGFSVNLNKDASLTLFTIPFILAVLLWSISFHYGIKELKLTDLALIENFRILDSQKNGNVKLLARGIKEFEKLNLKIIKSAKYKSNFLYSGVIAFLIWYFLRLYLNT